MLDQFRIDASGMRFEFRLFQNILDALKAGSERFEIGRRPYGLDGDKALFDVDEIVPAGGQHGVDFIVFEAANVTEVVANAVEEELVDLDAQMLTERNAQLAFNQDLDDALGRSPQREGVLGACGDQANLEAAVERVQFIGDGEDLCGLAA